MSVDRISRTQLGGRKQRVSVSSDLIGHDETRLEQLNALVNEGRNTGKKRRGVAPPIPFAAITASNRRSAS